MTINNGETATLYIADYFDGRAGVQEPSAAEIAAFGASKVVAFFAKGAKTRLRNGMTASLGGFDFRVVASGASPHTENMTRVLLAPMEA